MYLIQAMLKTIRSILSNPNFASANRMQKVMPLAGKIVFFLYFALFISDCINIDVLYASLKGKVTFVDNPSISDSLFDTGNSHHISAFDAPVHQNNHQKFTGKDSGFRRDNIVKNVINEDEDSPGIEDAMLSSSFAEQGELPRPESEFQAGSTIQTLDRTISYQRILI
jgi:hypothetical protein